MLCCNGQFYTHHVHEELNRVGIVQSWYCTELVLYRVGIVQSWYCTELVLYRVGIVQSWYCTA